MDPRRVTAALAEFVASREFADLDQGALDAAKLSMLDGIAVAFAGRSEPAVRLLCGLDDQDGAGGAAGVIGHARRVRPSDAALINGTMMHALDFDDVHPVMFGHPTAAILPALLAAAAIHEASGRDLLTAFAAGVDVACLLGQYVGPAHYDAGFHATATLGAIGAAAACMRLVRGSADATAHALSLAATQAAGLKALFGSMAKPLHAGKAAQTGLFSARLALAGFTGRPDALECAGGFAAVQTSSPSVERFAAAFDEAPFVRSTSFKYHASCYLTHGMIDAVRTLRATRAIDPDAVSAIDVEAHPGCASVCDIEVPESGSAIKFSLRFLCAMALDGQNLAAADSYSDETARDARLLALSRRVRLHFTGTSPYAAHVSVRMADGRVLTAAADPSGRDDSTAERIEAKFLDLCASDAGESAARNVVARIRSAETIHSVGFEELGLHRLLPLTTT